MRLSHQFVPIIVAQEGAIVRLAELQRERWVYLRP
jgi:hypothetical protein